MESLVILFGLAFVALVFVLPIVALTLAHSTTKRVKRLEIMAALAEERAEMALRHSASVDARLTAWAEHFQREVVLPAPTSSVTQPSASAPTQPGAGHPAVPDSATTSLRTDPSGESAVAAIEPPEITPDFPPSIDGVHAPSTLDGSELPNAREDELPTATAPNVPPLPMSAPQVTLVDSQRFDWERLVGVRLFAWLGGGTLFLAAVLFLQFSIQHNLVAPEIRVASGLLIGAIALFGGDRIVRNTPLAGSALCGAGVAILYAALFSAHSVYSIIDVIPAFVGMGVVTVTAGMLAVRRSAYLIGFLGLLGGMATPVLLSTGQDRPIALFFYVAALSVGVVYVSQLKGWPSLGLIGFVGATTLYVGWSQAHLDSARSIYALFAFTIVSTIYALGRLNNARRPNDVFGPLVAVASGLGPFVAALGIGPIHQAFLPPVSLSVHLIVVAALSWFVSKREALPMSAVAAGMSVLVWLKHLNATFLTDSEALTYFALLLLPFAHFTAWFWQHRRGEGGRLYAGLLIVLAGCVPLTVAARMATTEASWFGALIYPAINVAMLIAVAWVTERGLPAALAHATVLASTAVIAMTSKGALALQLGLATLAYALVSFALPLLHSKLRKTPLAWISAALALPTHFALLYYTSAASWGRPLLGTIALGAAALSVVLLAHIRNWEFPPPLTQRRIHALLGGGSLLLLTAAFPILLSNQWLTVSWALEAFAVCWLFRRVSEPGLLWFAALVALGVAVRLSFNPALFHYHERSATPIWNHYLYTFGVPIVSFYTGAWMIRHEEAARKLRLPAFLGFLGTLLAFILINIEVADYFSTGRSLTFNWQGGGSFAEDMTYSLAWGAFGITLLVFGLLLGIRAMRIGALLVLVLTIGKVFLHDLWELGSLYRVGSIVGLAVALLGVSYLTQRYILPKEQP